MSTEKLPTQIVIGPVRFSYLNVWEAAAMQEGDKEKYSASLIIKKSDKKNIAIIEKAIEAAKELGKTNAFKGKIPKSLEISFYDGDEKKPDDEAYNDAMYISAKSNNRPGLVDKKVQPILDQDELKSGDYGFASLNFYPYNFKGKMGIACGLNHLMKTKDGDPLAGRSSAATDFAEIAGLDEEDEDDLLA